MSTVLLDTNIVSYLFKRDSRAIQYQPHLLDRELAISLMTVAELLQWPGMRHWSSYRAERLEAAIHNYTILPIDFETCRWWAKLRTERSALGLPISSQDAWVAATALHYQLPVVTHNPDDFEQISGLALITESGTRIHPR